MHSQGVGVVTEDGAGAAHVDTLHSSIDTAGAVQRVVVSAALGLGVPLELDVSPVLIIAPPGAPGVLDEPVVTLRSVCPVADEEDSVVDNNILVIVTAVEHTFMLTSQHLMIGNTQNMPPK